MSTTIEKAIYNRSSLLLGDDTTNRMESVRVLLFGVGGVGSWCAEGLVRSGVTNITLVDSDTVCITNVNRQAMALPSTVGKIKVEVLKDRLLSINPNANITALQKIFSKETADEFDMDSYDYIIDAVDSLKDKAELILRATQTRAEFFSSMGAALKVDPTKVRVAEFWDVKGCPLGAALRKKLKRAKTYPAHKFLCVYDEEVLPNRGENKVCKLSADMCPKIQAAEDGQVQAWCETKAQTNGSLAHITAIFGMTICGLIISDIYNKTLASQMQQQ